MRYLIRVLEILQQYLRMFSDRRDCREYERAIAELAESTPLKRERLIDDPEFQRKRQELKKLRLKLELSEKCDSIVQETN